VLIIRRSKLYYTASGIVTPCRWPSGAQVLTKSGSSRHLVRCAGFDQIWIFSTPFHKRPQYQFSREFRRVAAALTREQTKTQMGGRIGGEGSRRGQQALFATMRSCLKSPHFADTVYCVQCNFYNRVFLHTILVLSYSNDGLISIKFSWEKTLKLMVVISPPPAKQIAKSNYGKDSRICRTIV